MKSIRESFSLSSNFKLNKSSKKIPHSQSKFISNFSIKKNKIIRVYSNFKIKSKKKLSSSSSFSFNRDSLKIFFFEANQAKELINKTRKSVSFQRSEKTKKQFGKLLTKSDKLNEYLKYMRLKTFKKISKKYCSPYIYDFKEKEKNYSKKQIENFIYYNYYLISNLIEKKKNRFNLKYNEYLYLYNKQEYLIKYFNRNERYIIMNYLLYMVYDKDIATVVKRAKKLLTNDEINNMFNNLEKNNYNFLGTMEIVKGIAVYYKLQKSNTPNIKKATNFEKIKPIQGQKINYKFIKDIPSDMLSNCIPHYCLLEEKVFNYIKDFTNKRKYKKINEPNENSQIQEKKKKKKQYYDSSKVSKSILANISLLSKEKSDHEETKENYEIKYRQNNIKRIKNDYETIDFEILSRKLSGLLKNGNKTIKNKNYSEKIHRKVKLKSKRSQSVIEVPLNNNKKKQKFFQSSKLMNTQILNIQNINKKIFKTSLKHPGITNHKNVVHFKNINHNNLTKSKNSSFTKNYMNDTKKNFNKFTSINNLKYNVNNHKNTRNKNNKKIIAFDGLNNDNSNNLISNSIKEVSSNDSLFFHKIKNISNFISQANNNKYSINKNISLKKFSNFSTKKFSKPKNIKFYRAIKQAFSPYSGMVFEDKKANVWENNKIDTDIINVAVKTSYLLKKIGNSFNTNFKSSDNSNTLEKLIKNPIIYFSNCK